MKKQVVLAAIFGISLGAAMAVGANNAPAADLTAADKEFMRETAIGGITEVKLGKLAVKNGANARVKDFGRHMVSDHTKANESLEMLAGKKGVKLPTECDTKHQEVINKLSKLTGDKFDHDFMDQMLDDHKKVIADLEAEEKTTDVALKDWCQKTLPTIKEHLKMAQNVDAIVDQK
jgi:putative membrane protein